MTDEPVIEIRRSRKKFISRSLQTYGTLVAVALIGGIIFGDIRGRIFAAALALLIGLGLSVVYQRRARVLVSARGLGLRGWGGVRWIPRGEIARAVYVESLQARDGEKSRELFVFDGTGRRIARLSGLVWGNKAVLRATHALAVPLVTLDRTITPRQLVTAEPRALRWLERRLAR